MFEDTAFGGTVNVIISRRGLFNFDTRLTGGTNLHIKFREV